MKLCIQTQDIIDNFGAKKGYAMIKEAGFEGVDLELYQSWKFSALLRAEKLEGLCVFEGSVEDALEYYSEQLACIKENGLVISQAHAPFGSLSTLRPDVVEYAIGIYKNVIKFCSAIGCPYVVIHGITKKETEKKVTVEEVDAMNEHLYESLIPTLLENEGVTVCLENLLVGAKQLRCTDFWEGHCSNPHLACEIIDRLNEKAGRRCFGLCFDTGHLNLLRKPFHSYMPILGDRIVTLHIHDNSQSFDSHLMPYTGTSHWDEFLRQLVRIGYTGDLCFETFAQTDFKRLPAELVPTFLRTIHDIGEYFRATVSK